MATKRKCKNTGGKPLIITFVCLVAVTLAVFGVFFGADKYERSTHPMLYSDLVNRYSSQYKLDKYAVYSFICVESGFNENSESYLGARGLMQIMPETFEWIRYKLNEENDPNMTFDNMYNAEDNIRYGCFLLGYLTDTFGELGEVAAAYHAGSGSVSSWLEDSRYTKNGILTDIPNPDTAHYVDKITNAYDTYCRLYKK